jgi:putative toxin-antitoxin system antitoxin component (TIGR02293 family)
MIGDLRPAKSCSGGNLSTEVIAADEKSDAGDPPGRSALQMQNAASSGILTFRQFRLLLWQSCQGGLMSLANITGGKRGPRKSLAQPALKSLRLLVAKIRARSVAANMDINELVKSGLPAQIVYSDPALAARLVRTGTIARRTLAYAGENNIDTFSPAVSEKIVRMIRITELARDAFGDEAESWLDRVTPVFGGHAPADMLGTESGAQAVEMFIGQAMHGFAA